MTLHESVLPAEIVSFLTPAMAPVGKTLFLDCTVGGAGHTETLLSLGESVFVVGLDQDASALARAAEKLRRFGKRVLLVKANFRHVESICSAPEIRSFCSDANQGIFHGILLDAGFSSDQLNDPARGFSYSHDGPLDMRLDTSQGVTADDIVNRAEAGELRRVFRNGGVREGAELLVRKIIASRPITGTKHFAAVCEAALLPLTRKRKERSANSATVPFQAVRIAVNEELDALEEFFVGALQILRPRGRLAVISFHSLEDRIVTRAMRRWEQGDVHQRKLPIRGEILGLGSLLTKKAVVAGEEEVRRNPRARSSRLRVFEKGETLSEGRI